MSLNKVGGVLSAGLTGLNQPVTTVEYLVVAGGGGGAGRAAGAVAWLGRRRGDRPWRRQR